MSCSQCGKKEPDPGFKKCPDCLAYMREYKKLYRARPKQPGHCSNTDCKNQVDEPYRRCVVCREKTRARETTDAFRSKTSTSQRQLKLEVFAAYGGACKCCGEKRHELLSIDHMNGYIEGPRKGAALYFWLRTHNFPEGFQVLCMTCNFTLGHHGYCPHSNLTQVCKAGRPRTRPIAPDEEAQKERKRAYWASYKLDVMLAYGGAVCVCCGEDHLECLSIDHVDGKGADHRRELAALGFRGSNICIYLKQQGYPPGFRVLCLGCNFAMGHFGYCPHQRDTLTKELSHG